MFNIDMTGRAAAVIGGARGIGAAVCEAIALAGGNVAWTHLGNDADIAGSAQLASHVKSLEVECFDQAVDCVDSRPTEEFIAEIVRRWGGLDYLVYSAGFTSPVGFMDITPDEWRRVVDINLNGAFIATRAAIAPMRACGGAVVLVGSAAIASGGGGRADYVSAKAGLEGLSRAFVKEFSSDNIRCNLVHPSLIDTDLLKQRHPDPAKRAELGGRVPLGRLGRPEDVANMVLFLLSEHASYITGQSIYVDGGRTFCG